MPGGWQTYRCDRCPLIIELGGYTAWDDAGEVLSETLHIACAECGTLHMITVENGVCEVKALPGPVRSTKLVKRLDAAGHEVECTGWVGEGEWQSIGLHPGKVGEFGRLICNYCGRVGRFISLESFLYPGGYSEGLRTTDECPLCHGPTECVGITDAV